MSAASQSLSRASPVLGAPGAAEVASPKTMGDLLRSAALLVSVQEAGGKSANFEQSRKHCRRLIEQFGEALGQRGYPEDVRYEAVVALCALIDESSVRFLRHADKDNWLSEPLQVTLFQRHNAGQFVFERLEARMREVSPDADLLECYAAILGLGLTGRYAVQGEAKRQSLMLDLSALIQRLRPASASPFLVELGRLRFGARLHRFSSLIIVGLTALCAVSMWLVWHFALDAQGVWAVSRDIRISQP